MALPYLSFHIESCRTFLDNIITMRRTLFFIISLLSLTLAASAQEEVTEVKAQPAAAQLKIGYFSYDEVLRAMPQYAIAQANLKALRSQYDDEMEKGEKEFNEKYELFIEEQRAMAKVIREKRQSELQNMMERNVAFRKEAVRLLAQAEADAMAPLHERISEVVKAVGIERVYAMIVNTDSNACPFLSPVMAEDITYLLIDRLK